MIPNFLIEFFYHLIMLKLASFGEVYHFKTYFMALYDQLFAHAYGGDAGTQEIGLDLLSYAFYLLLYEGIIVCSVLVGGFYFLIKKRDYKEIFVYMQFLLPFIIFTFFMRQDYLRYLVVALPAIALIVGYNLYYFSNWLEKKLPSKIGHYIYTSLIILILLTGGIKSTNTWKLQGGWQEAVEWCKEHNAKYVLTTTFPCVDVYFGNTKSAVPPSSLEGIKNAYFNKGYRYYLADSDNYRGSIHIIEQIIEPIHKVQNQGWECLTPWLEQNLIYEQIMKRYKNERERNKEIWIYDLQDYFEPDK